MLPAPIVPFPEDRDCLYKALGEGLVRWQYIETAFYLIALALTGMEQKTCSLMFFHIKSAENKLSLIDRLIFTNIKQAERTKHWTPISKSIAGAIKFRNSLAHFEYFILTDENFKAIRPKTKFRYALSSHHLDYYAGRSGTVKVLSVESTIHNSNELRQLTYQLIYFLVDHIPHLERLTASLEPRLLHWLDQFRKNPRPPGFEPPRKSSRPKQTFG
jgi:hypothetical protein